MVLHILYTTLINIWGEQHASFFSTFIPQKQHFQLPQTKYGKCKNFSLVDSSSLSPCVTSTVSQFICLIYMFRYKHVYENVQIKALALASSFTLFQLAI